MNIRQWILINVMINIIYNMTIFTTYSTLWFPPLLPKKLLKFSKEFLHHVQSFHYCLINKLTKLLLILIVFFSLKLKLIEHFIIFIVSLRLHHYNISIKQICFLCWVLLLWQFLWVNNILWISSKHNGSCLEAIKIKNELYSTLNLQGLIFTLIFTRIFCNGLDFK